MVQIRGKGLVRPRPVLIPPKVAVRMVPGLQRLAEPDRLVQDQRGSLPLRTSRKRRHHPAGPLLGSPMRTPRAVPNQTITPARDPKVVPRPRAKATRGQVRVHRSRPRRKGGRVPSQHRRGLPLPLSRHRKRVHIKTRVRGLTEPGKRLTASPIRAMPSKESSNTWSKNREMLRRSRARHAADRIARSVRELPIRPVPVGGDPARNQAGRPALLPLAAVTIRNPRASQQGRRPRPQQASRNRRLRARAVTTMPPDSRPAVATSLPGRVIAPRRMPRVDRRVSHLRHPVGPSLPRIARA